MRDLICILGYVLAAIAVFFIIFFLATGRYVKNENYFLHKQEQKTEVIKQINEVNAYVQQLSATATEDLDDPNLVRKITGKSFVVTGYGNALQGSVNEKMKWKHFYDQRDEYVEAVDAFIELLQTNSLHEEDQKLLAMVKSLEIVKR